MSGEIVGDEIASNLRMDTYNKILKMPMEWFDKRENTCGAISSKLSVDCEKVKDLLTTYIFIIVRSITTIISGFVIMFVYQWKLSLAIVAFITVLIVCGLARSYFKTKLAKQADVIRRKTCGMIEESLINIRTVSSFNMQSCLIQRYDEELQAPSKSLIKIGAITGVMNSISLFIVVSVIPVTLYIGILILINDGASIINIMTPAFSFYLMALALSKNISFLPDAQGAKIAAVNIFSILDGEDEEQVQVKQKSKMLTEGFTSNIEFIDVSFKYTGRQQQVFDKLNLKINPG
jgi:ATP-binding cassette subfamily B (MDR/TAP) protein 1